MTTVNIIINGEKVAAEAGQTILDAAQAVGVDVPTMCHHSALKPIGACRICLVELLPQKVLQPACTFQVADGMEIQTENERVINARKLALEFLFSERNHYCMYCQASGDCELQDLAYHYGLDHWMFERPAQRMPIDASRKYFVMEYNRCVLCQRCMRACSEIAANHTLGMRDRGVKSMVIADLDVPFGESSCVACGTCLQVCPTGSLMDRRRAYGGKEENITYTRTACTQCGVGCTVDVGSRDARLLEVKGVFGEGPSAGLLCENGRFKPMFETRERVTTPLVRKNGELVEAGWDEALDLVASKLKGGKAVGVTSGAVTDEALGAFAGLLGKAGGKVVGAAAAQPGFGRQATVQDIASSDFIIVAGAEPLVTHKVVGYFVKRALDRGARMAFVGHQDGALSQYTDIRMPEAEAAKVAAMAAQAERPVIIFGERAGAATFDGLKPLGDKALVLSLCTARNQGAASLAGSADALKGAAVVFMMLGEVETDAAFVNTNGAFKVVQATYRTPLVEQADVVLPAPIWAERAGHFTNVEGRAVDVKPAMAMPEGVRGEAEVLEALGGLV